jgi:hypothetical protein
MGSERGSAALAVITALALSTAVGVGVYFVIKEQRATARTEARAEPPPTSAVPDPMPPAPLPTAESAVPPPPPAPVDIAEADAVDPEVDSDPPETNAPMFGTPGVEGQLDKEGIAAAVRVTSPKLQRCFEKRLAAGAKIGGTLRATLVVNRRGGVDSATAVGVDDELGACVSAVLDNVRLPRTRDGGTAKVVYPIAFHNADGTDEGVAPGDIADGIPSAPEEACDEVSCVLDDYEGPCCAQYRRPRTAPAPSLPDSISRGELSTVLQSLRGQVARCASAQEFVGVFKVKFRVLPSGKVGDVTVADVAPALGACVARLFKAYEFPPSVNGVSASFPFRVE